MLNNRLLWCVLVLFALEGSFSSASFKVNQGLKTTNIVASRFSGRGTINQPPFSSSPYTEYKQAEKYRNEFLTVDSRKGFVNKVYAIFSTQMLSTVAIVAAIMKNAGLASLFVQNYAIIAIISSITSLGLIPLLLSRNTSNKVKYSCLAVFSLAESLLLAGTTIFINPNLVVTAALHTMTAFLGITLYASQSQFDLTASTVGLLAAISSLLIGTIINLSLNIPLLENVLSGLAALVFAGFVFYDTQMIMGGKHRSRQYGPKDAIAASVNLYVDVVRLFVELLRILKRFQDDKERKRDN